MNYQQETLTIFKQFEHLFNDNQSALSVHLLGKRMGEPFYVMADGLIRWAKAHEKYYGSPLGKDYYCRPLFIAIAYALTQAGSTIGVIALDKGITTDSKDNSVLFNLVMEACRIAEINSEELTK